LAAPVKAGELGPDLVGPTGVLVGAPVELMTVPLLITLDEPPVPVGRMTLVDKVLDGQ